jgi:class 3 adenylate cyclase/DNA-binding response OmpR family regulator
MDRLRTLVIDNSAEVRQFVTENILEPEGYEIDSAIDGVEGLHKALENAPDLILMDFEIPKMTGPEVLRELRKQNNNVPVILMTSHSSEQIAVDVFRLGVHDYIIKPFEPQEMLAAINKALLVTRLQREKETLAKRVMQTNQQLTQRIDELNALDQVGKSITALIQPDEVLERVVDTVLAITRSEACALVLVDSRSGRVINHLRKWYSGQQRELGQSDLPDIKMLTPYALGLNGSARKNSTETVLSVPIQIGREVFGTLSICKQVNGKITCHDDRVLGMLANYAAVAIQNLRLVYQHQLSVEREKQQIGGMFERCVAPSVVEQILKRPGHMALGGKRQALTVLFANVRGVSTFGAKISPEILIQLLNQYMRVAADAVLVQKGTLDRFTGDAIMAFFNAPLPQPDHPVRAIRAALRLSRSVKALHRGLPEPYRLRFGVGVGIGEAVVGNIGTAQMMNYTIIGAPVNKVKRLQENAKGGQILIAQETYRLVRDYIEAQPVGRIQLKGQSKPEPVYEVLDVSSG